MKHKCVHWCVYCDKAVGKNRFKHEGLWFCSVEHFKLWLADLLFIGGGS
jgi:hypothetical protein